MSRSLGKLIADKYINEDGTPVSEPKKKRKRFSVKDEETVLIALRTIVEGDKSTGRALRGVYARRIAMNALNDIHMPAAVTPR